MHQNNKMHVNNNNNNNNKKNSTYSYFDISIFFHPRGFFNPLPDHAGHCWDPHLPAGSVPGPVCQPGARVCLEMYPSSSR